MWYIFSVEEKRRPGRPKTTGVTPKRNIRVGPIWDEAETYAKENGETMTALVTRLLHGYVAAKHSEPADEKAPQDEPAGP